MNVDEWWCPVVMTKELSTRNHTTSSFYLYCTCTSKSTRYPVPKVRVQVSIPGTAVQ